MQFFANSLTSATTVPTGRLTARLSLFWNSPPQLYVERNSSALCGCFSPMPAHPASGSRQSRTILAKERRLLLIWQFICTLSSCHSHLSQIVDLAVGNLYEATPYELLNKAIDLFSRKFIGKKSLDGSAESLCCSRLRGFTLRQIGDYHTYPFR